MLEEIPNVKSLLQSKISVKIIYEHLKFGDIKLDLLLAQNHTKITSEVGNVLEMETQLALEELHSKQLVTGSD